MKNNKLHKIAPKLSEISLNKSGFEIPENYFETIENAVLSELNVDTIQSKTTKETFTTPENYFDSIEDLVLAKISVSPKVISLKTRLIKYIAPVAIAASLLLIFVLNNNSTKVSFDSLTFNEVENWIVNGSVDYDALSVASMYPEIELKNEIFPISISDNEVLDYLYDEDLEAIIYEN